METFDTPEQIKAYQAITLKHALLVYARTGMQVNTAYTPKNMLLGAEQITGKKFKRGQYQQAADALDEWVKAHPKDATP